ncbi:F-box domain [Macleaya cordata]|uniref:F-box domain n=1 Tax=Macleaya cordata TaxID=56857 RepID=A0A200R910_MACCD|nr:F-box domain [Macleaya cordata]
MTRDIDNVALADHAFGKLPDHLLIEIFIRVPVLDWVHISCVKQQWANLFRGECLWQSALLRTWPSADQGKRWPGPIPRGLSKRRYAALYVSKHIFACDGEIDEIMGHTYLFLKEELELSNMPPPSGILHGTIIADQFIACGKSRDKAHELASQIWLAVIDNLEENEHTFLLLKRLAQEGDIFLPYPYSRSYKIQWRVFEKLFTDFRDCFNRVDYYDILACAKYKFQPIPSAWLGLVSSHLGSIYTLAKITFAKSGRLLFIVRWLRRGSLVCSFLSAVFA